MKTALRIVAVLLVLQGLLFLAYVGIERARNDVPVSAVRRSDPAPDLMLESSDGSVMRVSELHGATVVLHFWATWCPPCREELPSLLELSSSVPARVLAVSVDPEWSAVRSFVEPASLESVYLASSEAVSDAFGVDDLPQTFVIDANGTLRLHFRGAQDWRSRSLRAMIVDP